MESPQPSSVNPAPLGDALADLWERRDRSSVVADAAYQTLHEAIIQGILTPGARLAEEDLASRFAVSRTPIREAILRLESEGLAERSSRKGLTVARVTLAEIVETYVVRQTLDGLAARLAAENATPTEVATLRWLNDQMREAGALSLEDFSRINYAFHAALYKASHNVYLQELMVTAYNRVRRYPGTTLADLDRQRVVVAEHDEEIDAIERRDAEHAEQLARRHISHALEVRKLLLYEALQDGVG